jgi:membrane dipeptidase
MVMSKQGRRLEKWGAYRAFGYLEEGIDFPAMEMAPAAGRVPEASIEWDPATETHAREIEETSLVASAHDHLSLRPQDPAHYAAYRRSGRERLAYEGIAGSAVDIFFDGGPAAVSMIRSHTSWDWDDAVSDLAVRQSDWAHQRLVTAIRTVEDLEVAKADDHVGVVLTMEGATPIGTDVDRLDVLHGLGVRLMGLVYNESNQLGSGLTENGDGGLTRLGKAAVRRMNQLGIIIDVSHAGDRTALDAIECSEHPVAITHAGCRELWPTPRMKPDDIIRASAATGGFIGIEAAPHTTITRTHPRHDLESVMEHTERCIELVGVEHVVFGPDTNFGDHAAWHREFGHIFGHSSGKPGTLPPHESRMCVAARIRRRLFTT